MITQELIEAHGLTQEEYAKICDTLRREPNLTELGMFSVMWSEHCSYKSSRLHLKRLPTRGPVVLQGPGENAGVIDIGEGLAAIFKIESHNHPSFIEPFQGAATGVGGIIRDIFTMGARPLALLNSLRFGPLTSKQNRSILRGVVSGIGFYGNCMGIPTVGGEVVFEDCYSLNPLVNVFCLGVAPHDKIYYGRAKIPGNSVYYVGAKTGRDGIHGATMASAEFAEETESKRPNVQVGDPFMEKLLLEACLELMQQDILEGIQDMGAAGLTCATSEIASRGGSGMKIHLDSVPQREKNMSAYEILLSESQERMLMVVKKGHEQEAERIFEKYDLHAENIGTISEDSWLHIQYQGKEVASVPARALAEEAPVYSRPLQEPSQRYPEFQGDLPEDYNDVARRILRLPTVASKHWVYRQYDHTVRTNTISMPGTATPMIRIKDTSIDLAMSVDGNGRFCELDPYVGSQIAVAEAARNVVCAGAKPVAITNCLNFGNPEKPHIMWQFSRVVDGIAKACETFGTPVTGGNVSFYNETEGQAIYPTPTIGMVGILRDGEPLSPHFKREEDVVVLVGPSGDEIGGSQYATLNAPLTGPCPKLDLELEKRSHRALLQAASEELLQSLHDCSDGGLIATVAESCFGAYPIKLGCELNWEGSSRPDAFLFGETQSRYLLSCRSESLSRLREIFEFHRISYFVLGKTGGREVAIRFSGDLLIRLSVQELYEIWYNSFTNQLR
ncbi:phosphoribosylformylglycinamidine synthase subunit PurL [bacterium]|nr:phosphoribosylformylglycinamidine synthase subunit PurL [bacterium]MCI0605292.1 phosphoribosylformylglycinamidine synthase subunit PurL [bacterium]